ncbi:transcriptional regulator, PadR-like family [Fibrella aestuarina BUZ 2]|uniref:Transcriptional regulator, PadR-like family n=1 Tax=Fibrella aestuarina BUZ 2 TaxID=1166018 RepID=I0KCG1_9BACT|nr:PadR family transcriptional regulator [Fibrella aestuarina]CCH01814.1 transcriptional regulator, PadR-like family [Fibrella aestuarina BUZ 2]
MNIENAQVQMRKGILEFCILHIISRGEIYASDMLDELTSARIMVVEGTLYPLLTRLKNAGLLDYKWVESTSGPPRKYYMLTELGRNSLEALNETWQELADSVRMIIDSRNGNGNGAGKASTPVQPVPVAPAPVTAGPPASTPNLDIVLPEPKQPQ